MILDKCYFVFENNENIEYELFKFINLDDLKFKFY